MISSATFALGGEIQGPGKSATPTPTPTALKTASTSDDLTETTPTEELRTVWPDTTTMLVTILLTIF